jgi:serine protease Do
MKSYLNKPLLLILGAALILPAVLFGQDDNEKKEKDKERKESQEIVIVRKGDKGEKVTVVVDGDKVTVNGKPLDEYKGDDVTVRSRKIRDPYAFNYDFNGVGGQSWNFNNDAVKYFSVDSNRAMLGVTTEKADKGVEIQGVTKESGAAKAGLKEGDVITKIDDKKIEDPDDLSSAVKAHKPGEKVTITYLREGKEQKATAELSRWKMANIYSISPNVRMDMGDLKLDQIMPKIQQTMPRIRTPYGQNWIWSGGNPRLGLSVQDTDDGKGVKVIDVDDESNAYKAGIREDDIITEVDGKTVNSADEVAKIIKDNKEKSSVMIKLSRGGKTQNIEVKMPRKLKTADL